MKKAPFPQSIEDHNIYGKKYIPVGDSAMSPAMRRLRFMLAAVHAGPGEMWVLEQRFSAAF